MSGARQITISIVGDASRASTAFGQAGTAAGTFEGKITGASSKFSNFGSIVAGVVAAGAIQKVGGFLIDGAKGAMDDAAAMDRLKTAVTNTGTSFESQSTAIDEAIKKGQELAFSDGDIMSALTNLTNATGDSDEAMRRLGLAQDLARGTGMSLEQASKLLGKTSDENNSTLARYGIVLSDTATAQDVLNEVDKRFGGQAAAFAESDAGKWAELQLKMGELQETIGGALIPVFSLLATVIGTVFTVIEPLTTLIGENMIPVMLALTPVLVALGAAFLVSVIPPLYASAVAFLTLNAAALPWIALALAIGVAVAALYLAWSTNFLGIQDIVKTVIDFVGPYITTTIDALKTLFETVWPIISAVVDVAMQAIKTYVETYILIVQTVIETAIDVIKVLFETVWPIISAVVDVAMQAIDTYVTTYIGLIQTTVDTILPLIQGVFELVWPIISGVVETAMLAVSTAVDLGTAAAQLAVDTVLPAIQLAFQTVWDAIQVIIDTIAGPAGTVVSGVTDGINAAKLAVDVIKDVVQVFQDTWDDVQAIIDAIAGPGGTVVSTISDGVDAAVSAVEDVAGAMYNAGASLVQNLIDGVLDKLGALRDAIAKIGEAVSEIDVPLFSPIDEAGREMGESFVEEMAAGIERRIKSDLVPALASLGRAMPNLPGTTRIYATGGGSGSGGGGGGAAPVGGGGSSSSGDYAGYGGNYIQGNMASARAYAEKHGGFLHANGTVSFAPQRSGSAFGAGAGVFLDGKLVGWYVGEGHMRGKWKRKKLGPAPC